MLGNTDPDDGLTLEETMRPLLGCLFSMALLMASGGSITHAQAQSDFYRGKQIQLMVFTGPGATYDAYTRLLARHLSRHIPGNPNIIVQNLVGAGGLKLVDFLNRIAPRDGLTLGMVSRGNPFDPMLGKKEIEFDPLKLTWIGSMNRETAVALSWHTSPVKTFADAQKMELLVPGTGAGADSEIIPRAYNSLAGTKFKIISGYRDTAESTIQIEAGELQGIAYWSWSAMSSLRPDWIKDKKVNLLFHTSKKPLPEAPGVPSIHDLVKNEADRKALEFLLAREILGRPLVAPPGLPAERVQILRKAFEDTLADPEFLADAARGNFEINLVKAQEVETLLRESAALPPSVINRAKEAVTQR
jgi:tripartite-type tricarboxylate transporter receptor subunit TctC